MKKLSNKGFTLIELLATILIIGLVLGLTTYGIISSVKSAKDEGSKLTLAGIKESARTYSSEYTDDTWKASNKSNNIYFCTTIQELINKGLLDKNAKNVEGNTIGLNDYIAVIKDKKTKVIKKEEVLNLDTTEKEAYEYCTGNKKPENIKKLPTIKGEETYTDTIIAEFTDAEFKTSDGTSSNITERKCSYAKSRIDGGNAEFIENNNTTINGNKCKITGLESNTGYDIRVCMTSSNDSEACTTKNIKTLDIKEPTISINGNDSIKITYDDTNIIEAKGEHYFKSNIDGTTDKNVKYCSFSSNYNCNGETKVISKNTWYKVDDKEVKLSYTNSGDITITAVTRDKSGNYKSTDKNYSLYKTVFNRGTADKIDGQTSNVERLCLADRNKSCSITSPSIEKAGYSVVGWNTNSSATTSSWNVNISRSINKSETYYPITKLSTYTITYNNNNGSGCTSKTVNYNSQIGTLCTPKRKGYTFIGWYNSDYKDKPLNYYADTNPDLYNAFNYDADKLYNHYLTYGVNEGRRVAQYLSSDTYNYTKNITVYAGWKANKIKIKYNVNGGQLNTNNSAYSTSGSYVTLNGSTIIEAYNYGDMLGSNGLYNYNNPAYINIVRSGYKAVSGKEWYNDAKKTFNQATRYDVNDLCDASNSDCEVTLYVNWIKEDSINDYRCSGSDYYYITTCDSASSADARCNYTSKNKQSTSGTILRNNLTQCHKVTFYADGGKFSDGTTEFFFMATAGVRYTFDSSYYLTNITMPRISRSGCSLYGWYYYPESKVIRQWFDVDSDEYNIELKANWYCPSSGGNTGGTKYCGPKQDCHCNVAKECEGCGVQGKTQYFRCDKDPTSSKKQCFWSNDNKVWHSCY
ncbi:MAG: InlB B-repeat-containing protein [Clostridium sp.]|nr:InlB B-repeat-containing protein [Clostridium sp.]